MNADKLKGTLLEYIIRKLLENNGFSKVYADGLYIFNTSGLTMINGKGAAHDADVLMEPPIQMPFLNPFRVNFECKSYSKTIGLGIIRGALGLRYDLNDFEIITEEHLIQRRNNRRVNQAIQFRTRYNYQIGVASVEDFSKPAFEFAANNKIPLISLRWFLDNDVCDKFHDITSAYVRRFNQDDLQELYRFLKGEESSIAERFLRNQASHFKDILSAFNEFQDKVLIGLTELGNMIFVFSNNISTIEKFRATNILTLNARYHYFQQNPNLWHIDLGNGNNELLKFYLPREIIESWSNHRFENEEARNIKRNIFKKLIIFTNNEDIPFKILKLDRNWLDNLPPE